MTSAASDRVEFRRLTGGDSLADLTELLHRAYAPLLAAGLNYTASYQDEEITRRRCGDGTCFVGVLDGRIVATAVLRGPLPKSKVELYRRPGVFSFGQFAVEPALQGRGVGSRLLAVLEAEAAAQGAVELACDTAVPAAHLVRYYAARGYRTVDLTRWDGKTYESFLLSKPLA